MDSWLKEHLVCPRHRHKLKVSRHRLLCVEGHEYPYVDGIPVLLLHGQDVHVDVGSLDSTEIEEDVARTTIDAYVQRMVAGTCGNMYVDLINRLPRYPIPDVRLPAVSCDRLLDIGCGWGRWSIAAARKGYSVVGIDPSIDAVRAARRVSHALGAPANFVVADARHLPFRDESFDVAFSYSVLQHFAKDDVRMCLTEIVRTLKKHGVSLIEMPNAIGIWNVFQRFKRRGRPPTGFDVRYWSPRELKETFTALIGPSSICADSFFFINGQPSDRDILRRRYKALVSLSDLLRRASGPASWLTYVADSLYIRSERADVHIP